MIKSSVSKKRKFPHLADKDELGYLNAHEFDKMTLVREDYKPAQDAPAWGLYKPQDGTARSSWEKQTDGATDIR